MKYDRREFLKTGSIVVLGSLAAPSLIGGCKSGTIDKTSEFSGVLNHFGVTERDLKKVLAAALEKGGDYADLFFEHTFWNSIRLQDGAVNSAFSDIDFGMGVRVLSGNQTGYAYVEKLTLEEMLKAAKTAAKIASEPTVKEPVKLTEEKITDSLYKVKTSWEDFSVKEKVPYLKKINERIFSLDNRVTKVIAVLTDVSSHILFCNSEGTLYYDYRPMVALQASCIMEENGKFENGSAARSFRMGAEFLTDEIIETLANETVQKTAILFQAIKPKGGEMPVVMGSGGSGILLHEAIGHAFEADFNRKNISIFSDLLNKKICNENITVIDDGTIPFNRGSVNIDDDGIIGQKTYIVTNGVLSSYLHDRVSAKHYGIPSTGNGRRESFRKMPLPRMRATYMEAGNHSEEEIISSVKNGIFASVFTNGQVQIGAGDFTFFMKSGYLIENGKLTQPIKDVNIIGNGPKALEDITMVGNNYLMDDGTWTCGKSGQSCPVTCGMPSVLVNKLTVGGES